MINSFIKQFLFIVFLFFCSLAAYGQDLIITSTGDSLKCKIIDVSPDEIQFRFGSGNVISIKRSEAASYEYNFEPAPTRTRQKEVKTKEKPQRTPSSRTKPANPPVYISLSAGPSLFGKLSFGDTEGMVLALGGDLAYFFNSWLGAGVKLNTLNCTIDFDDLKYKDMVMFLGPALHARFGQNNFKFNLCAAGGLLNWKLSDASGSYKFDDLSHKSFGTYLSAGVGYWFTKNIGVSFNINTMLGSVKDKEDKRFFNNNSNYPYERKLNNPGGSVGLNIRF